MLGRGCKGTTVYPGTLKSSGKSIAVKKMFNGLFDLNEAKRLKCLKHPNIIQCFAVEMTGEFIYLALELCKKTLTRCVEENDFTREDSGVERLKCLKEITGAVVYLHDRNICHRDIKPDNILLSLSTPQRFVLADFNTAREASSPDAKSTQIGTIVGTFGYIAPEVYRPGEEPVTVKMDIFSLGCVFYYTLTDTGHPFGSVKHLEKCQGNITNGKEPALVEADFRECVWTLPIIERMITSVPVQRPSGKEVMNSLEVRKVYFPCSSHVLISIII